MLTWQATTGVWELQYSRAGEKTGVGWGARGGKKANPFRRRGSGDKPHLKSKGGCSTGNGILWSPRGKIANVKGAKGTLRNTPQRGTRGRDVLELQNGRRNFTRSIKRERILGFTGGGKLKIDKERVLSLEGPNERETKHKEGVGASWEISETRLESTES